MKLRIACAVFGLACSLTAAAETAVTNRETEVKKEPFPEAATLATLPSKTSVEVLKRQGGWTQIKPASSTPGWVRMLNLRYGDGSEKSSGGSGLGNLFNVARTGSTGTEQTTGGRGLSPITKDSIESSNPNMKELKRMHSYTVSKAEALKFAHDAGLRKQSADYLPSARGGSSREPSREPGSVM